MVLDESCNTSNLNCRELSRLARLLAEQRDEFLGMLAEEVGEFQQQLLSLLEWRVPPSRECLLSSHDGIVEVLVGRNWDVPKLLAGSRVHAMVDILATSLLAIDGVVKLLEIQGRNF